MKAFSLIAILYFISSASYAENCSLDDLKEIQYTDIECQFYMGTAAYRNKVYTAAAAHWMYILDAPIKHEGDAHIKAMSLSTVTYLTYQGLGVEKDRNKAVRMWIDAVRKGDLEARRHLGFAYSDKKFKGYDLTKALGWYESVILLYPNPDVLDETDSSVYRDAVNGVSRLRRELTKRQIDEALKFAKSTL